MSKIKGKLIEVKIKRLSDTAILPTYGSTEAACLDLYADSKQLKWAYDGIVAINAHETVVIPTGFAFQPPTGYCGMIYARSGIATKKGLRPANCVGVCDEDYTGEYKVALHNDSNENIVIHHGDRIAQLMFVPYNQVKLEEVEELTETERGNGGFGSTGQ